MNIVLTDVAIGIWVRVRVSDIFMMCFQVRISVRAEVHERDKKWYLVRLWLGLGSRLRQHMVSGQIMVSAGVHDKVSGQDYG